VRIGGLDPVRRVWDVPVTRERRREAGPDRPLPLMAPVGVLPRGGLEIYFPTLRIVLPLIFNAFTEYDAPAAFRFGRKQCQSEIITGVVFITNAFRCFYGSLEFLGG